MERKNGFTFEPARPQRNSPPAKPSSTFDCISAGRDLDELVNPATRGDPKSPLLWTSKSARRLAMTYLFRDGPHPV
jgi:hypothetical protein